MAKVEKCESAEIVHGIKQMFGLGNGWQDRYRAFFKMDDAELLVNIMPHLMSGTYILEDLSTGERREFHYERNARIY